MPSYRTHITILQQVARLHPTSPAFQIPQYHPEDGTVVGYNPITYSRFFSDVELFAKYWTRKLTSDGISIGSVVGLWLGGMTYLDVLHIYSIVRAGYIPQLFSLRLPNPDVIFELLAQSRGKALIFDSSFDVIHSSNSTPVPTYMAIDVHDRTISDISLAPIAEGQDANATIMIFHTSGSTSGRPKLVPCSYEWWDACLKKAWHSSMPHNPARQDVTLWMGSMCHIGQTYMFAGSLLHAACTVQCSSLAFPSSELKAMSAHCGLNRINIFPTFLRTHISNSRRDPKLLEVLKSLDVIFYSGLMISEEDEEWIHSNGIKLINCFGNTESCAMLLSDTEWKGIRAPLVPMEGTTYGFFPISSESNQHQDPNSRLLELVILSESKDCPDRSLRSADGHYHTGDLFLEVSPGRYVSRGRNDDWIKSENSLRCDTKAIEDNVHLTCADLVTECIVVGNGRPSPVLFVEAEPGVNEEKMKKDIIRRTRHFHSRRYLHERITSTKCIIVVPKGTLPRTATKGNIRRRAVEEAYKAQLDAIFGVSH